MYLAKSSIGWLENVGKCIPNENHTVFSSLSELATVPRKILAVNLRMRTREYAQNINSFFACSISKLMQKMLHQIQILVVSSSLEKIEKIEHQPPLQNLMRRPEFVFYCI